MDSWIGFDWCGLVFRKGCDAMQCVCVCVLKVSAGVIVIVLVMLLFFGLDWIGLEVQIDR